MGVQGQGVNVYSAAGTLLANVPSNAGSSPLGAPQQIAGLSDGGFVVSGARGSNIAFRIYNADLTERTNGAVDVAVPGFFDGGVNTAHALRVLPNGGFAFAWTDFQGGITGSVGFLTGSPTTLINPGSNSGLDVRGSIYNASGTLVSSPAFLITQGNIAFDAAPDYTIDTRFGTQRLTDLDVLADGRLVATIHGERFSVPSGGNAQATSSTAYRYDSFRVVDGTTGAAITGETPYNATAPIGQEVSSNTYGPNQTVILGNGTVAGLFSINTGVAGPAQFQSWMQLYTPEGLAIGTRVDLALAFSSSFSAPQIRAIATDAGGFILAYVAPATAATAADRESYNLYVREYSGNGTAINTQQLSTATGYEIINNLSRGPDGTYIVTANTTVLGNFSTNTLTYRFVAAGAGDFVNNGGATAENVTATGSNRNWVFSGGGADTINGGSGTNYLYGDTGNSTFNGGGGVNIIRGGSGNEVMNGGALGDLLEGGGGNDILNAGGGNDTLLGGGGADALNGGDGLDTVSYAQASSGVVARLDLPGLNTGEAAGDTYSGIEVLIGSAFFDFLIGDGNANTISAGSSFDFVAGLNGDDTIHGEGGNDTLDGGAGSDTLDGGAGADSLTGGGGFDFAGYLSATIGVTARLDFSSLNNGDAAGDLYSGISGLIGSNSHDFLVGDSGVNYLAALGGDDYLAGNAGNDTILAGDGNDQFWGGEGADVLDGGAGYDIARYDFAAAGVVARLDGGTNAGEAAGDTFSGIEALYGSAFADILIGSAAGDVLVGLDGGDLLYGLGGNDLLLGGGGIDAFGFNTVGFGTDTVLDFATTAAAGANHDYVDFRGIPGLATFAINQVGANTHVVTNHGTVILQDINAGTLVAGDFLF